MAVMIPSFGPQETRSPAEPSIYWQLKTGLSDDFTVIHSLPWLCAAVKEIDGSFAPSGELDFLIVHANLGVLALEVKAGRYQVRGVEFVCLSGRDTRDPVGQVRRNVHGLAKWLGGSALRIRIGYGLVFPDSSLPADKLGPALRDLSLPHPESIVIDYTEMRNIASRVLAIFAYWKDADIAHAIGQKRKDELVNIMCPHFDGTPEWGVRVVHDDKVWLRLTEEQSEVLSLAETRSRMVVTGWPGSGKTVIAIELAKRSCLNQRVLFVVFNALLREWVASQFSEHAAVEVMTWHGLCSKARRALGLPRDESPEWFETGCVADLADAIKQGYLDEFQRFIIDEGQALGPTKLGLLVSALGTRPLHVFCDESQVFSFERGSTLAQIEESVGASAFHLTAVVRSPPAVTERLKSVKPDRRVQVTTIRRHDADALLEVLADDVFDVLAEWVNRLRGQHVAPADITLLTKMAYRPGEDDETLQFLRELGLRAETVARFRGLESPVVVIFADGMPEAELFCAYSRATSLCIAIYKPERFSWKQSNMGRFADALMRLPDFKAQVDRAHIAALSSTLLKSIFVPLAGMHTVRLAWMPQWQAWGVELSNGLDPSEMWIDYLMLHQSWPVYYWSSESRREVWSVDPVAPSLNEEFSPRGCKLEACQKCGCITPHSAWPALACRVCERKQDESINGPDQTVIERLLELDAIIARLIDGGEVQPDVIKQIPLPLIAVAQMAYAQQNGKRQLGRAELPTSKVFTYRLAMAFLLAKVQVTTHEVDRRALARRVWESYGGWSDDVTEEEWQRRVSIAISVCISTFKCLRKTTKSGVYEVISS